MDGRAPREDNGNKNRLSCLPKCRLSHQWDGEDRTHHRHSSPAQYRLITACRAARPGALGSGASVADGKGLPSQT